MASRKIPRALLLSVVASAVCLLVFEVGVRLLIEPSDRSYGRFFGHELPPLKLIPYKAPEPESERDSWYEDLIVDGKKIVTGDLWGFSREDPVLGYAPKESMTSVNGWWQSNSIGARERRETPRERPDGKRRVLVFGDSFAQGSRVPQEEAWPEVLESATDLDVVNLGVDGYSMAQSFLRYQQLKDALDHDLVLLVFVPIRDLWRDVNTIRSLAKDWDFYQVMPRYVLDGGELRLIESPYDIGSSIYEKNRESASPELVEHLRHFDRFYNESEYEEPALLGRLAAYKLFARAFYLLEKRNLSNGLLRPDSEAVRVSRRIFEAMGNEAGRCGKEFLLVFLPSHRDLEMLEGGGSYRDRWDEVVRLICKGDVKCVDLADDFLQAPSEQLDTGYDGTHFGPRANRLIADRLRPFLVSSVGSRPSVAAGQPE